LSLVLGGGALVLLGGAITFEVLGKNLMDDARATPVRDAQLDTWHRANTRRYVAEGFGAAALGLGVVALWQYFRDASDGETPRSVVAPHVTDHQVGISYLGAF